VTGRHCAAARRVVVDDGEPKLYLARRTGEGHDHVGAVEADRVALHGEALLGERPRQRG
jgi:hypothetical protein